MTGILMDEFGDVYLDEYNNTVEVDNQMAFQQILEGLIHCDIGSELMNRMYGFDLIRAITESDIAHGEMLIESLIAQAVNPQVERLISKLDYVKATKNGREMDVIIQVTSIFDETVTIEGELSAL